MDAYLWYIIEIIVATFSVLYWYRRPKNFPPGPRGFPLIGIVPYFGKCPERVLAQYGKKYGNIMSFRMGRQEWIVLNDLESINQGLVKQGYAFSGRPPSPLFDEMTNGCGVVFVDSGEKWKSQRKFGILTLRSLGMGKQLFENKVNLEYKNLLRIIKSYNESAFDILSVLKKCMASSISNILMGCQFDYDDENLQIIVDHSPTNSIVALIPSLRYLPIFRDKFQELVKSTYSIIRIIKHIIEEHKPNLDEENVRDFIDAFLIEMRNHSNTEEHNFTEEQLIHYIRDLLVGGIDTGVGTIGWALLLLLRFPSCEDRIHKEIDNVVGDAVPSMKHQAEMPYLCAFIQESMRFKTLAELNIPHCTKMDVELLGYNIPKGTPVMTNIWNVHNDERYWDKPEVFNPERHLNENGEFIKSNHVIPFAVGYRRCLGEQLAKVELFLFFVNFLREFKLDVDPLQGLPEFEKNRKTIVNTPRNFNIVARQR